MSNFMKIRPMGAELFHADGRMDRHDEANSCLLQFCKCPKMAANTTYNVIIILPVILSVSGVCLMQR